jgi:hypothetical protein
MENCYVIVGNNKGTWIDSVWLNEKEAQYRFFKLYFIHEYNDGKDILCRNCHKNIDIYPHSAAHGMIQHGQDYWASYEFVCADCVNGREILLNIDFNKKFEELCKEKIINTNYGSFEYTFHSKQFNKI